VKTDEQEVINFLLTTEIIPLCLRIMESGSELSKTVATFILQKILLDETGLYYICQTYDRFSHVAMILGKMVISLAKEPSGRLLKHVVRCYLRLSDNQRYFQNTSLIRRNILTHFILFFQGMRGPLSMLARPIKR